MKYISCNLRDYTFRIDNEPVDSAMCVGVADDHSSAVEVSRQKSREMDKKAGKKMVGSRFAGVSIDGDKAAALVRQWNRQIMVNSPEWFV